MDGALPAAPWRLTGEAMVGLVPRHGRSLGSLAHGLRPVPGPGLLLAQRLDASPVGSFCELALLEPARSGARIGWSVTFSVVSDARARAGGRTSWGLPRELGTLVWDMTGSGRVLTWRERGIVVRSTVRRGALPLLVGVRTLQHRSDGPVLMPLRMRGLAHRAALEVAVPEDDPLAGIAGRRPGLAISGLNARLQPARQAAGVVRTLAAPLHPPEPGSPVLGSSRAQW